ncbi:MAG: hypothetical protein JNM07_01660 [Phycisphaerae bacterium]|nr:hypothetical protein [Phycisphaerae bacterium]
MTGLAQPDISRAERFLKWTGFTLIWAAALLRAASPYSPFPAWDLDPLLFESPASGIGPAWSLSLDAILLLGAAAALGATLRGGPTPAPTLTLLALAALGAVPVVYHGWLAPHAGLDNRVQGSAWAASVFAAVAMSRLARDPRAARLALAALTGLAALLAVRGAQQVFLEHPRTVSEYLLNREVILAAHGWSPDSSTARTFERRLMQAEATGWFSLSNVFATFSAAGLVAASVLARSAFRSPVPPTPARDDARHTRLARAAIAAAVLLAFTALALAGSKGGFGAAAVALAGSAALAAACRAGWSVIPRLVGPACVAGVLAIVILRGLIGERLHELSLLFRAFYISAAARIGFENPVWGVGPASFKPWYVRFKSPLSPEEVASPHSVLCEWWAALGGFGLAWAALLLILLSRLASRPPEPHPRPTPDPADRNLARGLALGAATITILTVLLDGPSVGSEAILARVVGMLIGIPIGLAALAVSRGTSVTRGALGAAALAVAAHAQIEVTATWISSVSLALLLIAAAAPDTPATTPAIPVRRGSSTAPSLLPAALVLLALALGVFGAAPAWRWERELRAASDVVAPVAELSARVRLALSDDPLPDDPPSKLAAELSARLGRAVAPDAASLSRGLDSLAASLIPAAVDALARARAFDADDRKIGREISRLWLRLAQHAAQSRSSTVPDLIERAESAVTPRPGHPILAEDLYWLASIHQTAADLGLPRAEHLEQATHALEAATRIDPYGLIYRVKLFELRVALADRPGAARWAREALALDVQSRLDPLRGLSENQRRQMAEAARLP